MRRHCTNNRLLRSTGERATVWNTAAYAEPISGHAARRSVTAAPILRSAAQRILFRSESTFLRCHTLLLSERRPPTPSGQRPARCLLRGDQVLRVGRDGYQQVQVRTQLSLTLIAERSRRSSPSTPAGGNTNSDSVNPRRSPNSTIVSVTDPCVYRPPISLKSWTRSKDSLISRVGSPIDSEVDLFLKLSRCSMWFRDFTRPCHLPRGFIVPCSSQFSKRSDTPYRGYESMRL